MKTIKHAINWAKKATRQDWLRLIDKLLPHVAIIISGMLVVFFVIDRVNKPMGFMTNEFHKRITFVLSLLAIYMAVGRITGQRRMERERWRRQAQKAKQSSTTQPGRTPSSRPMANRPASPSAAARTGSTARTSAGRTSAGRVSTTGATAARASATRTGTSTSTRPTTRTTPRA